MLNLLLAAFWFCVAAALLYADLTDKQVFRVSGSGLEMLAVLALLLAVYNLVRWWAVRAAARRADERMPLMRHPRRVDSSSAQRDPAFDFSDEKPPEPPQQPS
jgi:hypothetical protein